MYSFTKERNLFLIVSGLDFFLIDSQPDWSQPVVIIANVELMNVLTCEGKNTGVNLRSQPLLRLYIQFGEFA